jgi:rod shape-determining protein MreC
MAESDRRLPVSLLVAVLVAIAVVSMVVDRRAVLEGGRALPGWLGSVLDITAPVQDAVAMPFDAVRNAWDGYISLLHVKLQNDALQGEVSRLSEENLQLREALVASGRLQRIADMREHYEVPMLPTELVGVDTSPWFRSVLVDHGRNRGVLSGMPVISEKGLVGLITATSLRSAKAMLVLDRQTSVDGVIQRSRSRGTVRGRGSDELEFEFVARNSDVQVNDLVITSGLGGVYPKGLFIGTISEVSDPGTQLLQRATIRPAVDFGRLEQVFVMLRRGPTMELLYSTRVGDESSPTESAGPSS